MCRFQGRAKEKKKLSDEALATLESEGHVVSAEGEKEDPVMVVKQMSGDEKFYGLGDKTGVLNKRNYEYENWNSDLPQAHTDDFKALYKSIPFLITLKDAGVFGMFFDNTYRSHVNLGKRTAPAIITVQRTEISIIILFPGKNDGYCGRLYLSDRKNPSAAALDIRTSSVKMGLYVS